MRRETKAINKYFLAAQVASWKEEWKLWNQQRQAASE